MPQVKIKSIAGSANIHYTISTPKNPSAKSIDKNLPTVILIHPVYIASELFELQFADPSLRRFNLIAFDLRSHGETSGKVGATYGREEAAADVMKFMEALHLPPCHFVGVSMGACISLQFAISFPQKALSLTMISPLPLTEPLDVAEGREEIHDCWVEAFKGGKVDQTALLDSVCGALQLGFSGQQTSLISALTARAVPHALKNWGPTKLGEYRIATIDFFVKRTAQSAANVRKIKCPIKLLHCGADIAYAIEYTEEVLKLLQENGVDAQLIEIPGAIHFGNVSNPKEINAQIHENVLQNSPGMSIPPAPATVVSPFTAALKKAGYNQDDGDSDSD
ncbi:AB hydrolase-1 domain-containing protein [Mycena venus]|uniref:AB hydrolase-1 domain-containing protein n=1 Tax=Mycena venus TaxID=2733690 RepID=A0A8H6YLM8_9AGAR|nr:AB hydrolase-1 domain-containing protein [Mycena venus]